MLCGVMILRRERLNSTGLFGGRFRACSAVTAPRGVLQALPEWEALAEGWAEGGGGSRRGPGEEGASAGRSGLRGLDWTRQAAVPRRCRAGTGGVNQWQAPGDQREASAETRQT